MHTQAYAHAGTITKWNLWILSLKKREKKHMNLVEESGRGDRGGIGGQQMMVGLY